MVYHKYFADQIAKCKKANFLSKKIEVIQLHLIIVEDLELDRENLKELIQKDCDANHQTVDFSCYKSGETFLNSYYAGICDALFLDILMDDISGIEVAEKVRKTEPRLPIIFTTTEPDFALEGFAVHATDYLVKPIVPSKISWCLKELREYLTAPTFLTLPEIGGRGHSSSRNIALNDILYGECQNHNMFIHTTTETIYIRLSFQDFQARLPHTGRFSVCSRGLVVNLSYVEQVRTGEILLKDGKKLPLSRRRTKEVRNAFSSWLFSRSRKGGWA